MFFSIFSIHHNIFFVSSHPPLFFLSVFSLSHSITAKIHQNFDPQLAVVISLPKREINARPFIMLRETNTNFGVFDNKVNRTYDEQINALRGWLVAMIKSIKPTTGSLFIATTQNNGGGKATSRGRGRGRGRGGRGRGRGGGGQNY